MSKQNSAMSGPIRPENQATTPDTTTNSGPVGPPNEPHLQQPTKNDEKKTENGK